MSVDPKRFRRADTVAIPDKQLSEYKAKSAPEPILSEPRTSNAHIAAAPTVAGAAQSVRESERGWWASLTHDPTLLVGAGVCAAVYIGSILLKRR